MPFRDPVKLKAYREREKVKAKLARQADPEGVRAKDRARYARDIEPQRKRKKAYRAKHPEKYRAFARKYYARDKEKISVKRAAEAPLWAARLRRWRHANPDKAQNQHAKYHANRQGAAVNDLTAAQWTEIKAAYGNRCVYCGRKMQRLTQDHIIPLSKGGHHTASNIVPACGSCNSKKQAGAPLVPVQPLLLTLAPARAS